MRNSAGDEEMFEQLGGALREYRVPYPVETEVDRTIESLRRYVPAKRKKASFHYESLKKLMKSTMISLNFMEASYWIITLLLYAAGCIVLTNLPGDPYKLIFVLAPMPMILGLLEVFRGREENVVELELSCKITPQEILISKILVICVYNIVLNAILSAILCLQSPIAILWRITLIWLCPMTFTGSAALWFCSKFRGTYSVLISLLCWTASSLVLVSQEQLLENILCLNPWYLIAFIGAGTVIFAREIIKMKNRYYFEGGLTAWN